MIMANLQKKKQTQKTSKRVSGGALFCYRFVPIYLTRCFIK